MRRSIDVLSRPGGKAALLRNHFLLQQLEDEDLNEISQAAGLARYRACEPIFSQGDCGTDLLFIATGRVKLSSTSADGRELLVNIAEPGHMLGEIAVLDGRPRSHDATAIEPTDVLVLRRRDLIPFLERRPEVCIKFLAVLCERLRRSEGLVQDTVFLRAGPRLARQLLRLAQVYGRPDGAATLIDVRISQGDLASLVGMSRESINKQLCGWRRAGMISHRGKTYKVVDMPALTRAAELD